MIVIAVDDERIALDHLVESIQQASPNAQIHRFRYPEDALAFAKENNVDVAFLDVEMIGMNGVELAERLKLYHTDINIIFSTGYGHYRDAAFELHASGYLTKPITPEKVRKELDDLRRPVRNPKRVQIRTFGNFEVYLDGSPINFKYSKTKEMLAYLVDRRGALCTNGEIIATLFEDDNSHEAYLRSLRKDMTDVLEAAGCGDILSQQRGRIGIVPERVECDYFSWYSGGPSAESSYNGEYMTQYSWGEFTNAMLSNSR
jgi:two-component SAPR family response regulator